jgi:hypothetical protein
MRPLSVLALAVPLLLVPFAGADAPKPKPLSEADLVKLIELLPIEDVITRVQKVGVSFKVDDAAVGRLKKAGANTRLIALLQGDKPLATGKNKRGVTVEIMEIKRTDEGLMQINWRYRNPTDKTVTVFDGPPVGFDTHLLRVTMKELYYTYRVKDTAFRSKIATDSANKVWAATAGELKVKAGGTSRALWAKFHIPPADVTTINLVFNDVEEPIKLTLPSLAK